MCRICGSEKYQTKDCCPTPIEKGLAIPMDDFEKLMYTVWSINNPTDDKIPYSVVRDFYQDWINGSPIDAESYLKSTSA